MQTKLSASNVKFNMPAVRTRFAILGKHHLASVLNDSPELFLPSERIPNGTRVMLIGNGQKKAVWRNGDVVLSISPLLDGL